MKKIIILGATIRFADVYKARVFADTVAKKYGVTFDLTGKQAEDLEEAGIPSRPKGGMFNATSNYGPTIIATDGDYGSMREAFDICDIRNISRDILFKDMVADIACCIFDYDTPARSGTALGIDRIALEGRPLVQIAKSYKATLEGV